MYVSDKILYLDGVTVVGEVLQLDGVISNGIFYISSDSYIYRHRMINYYPQAIQNILEFQSIIDCEYPEIYKLHKECDNVLSDAYLTTMSEARIKQWESALGIRPLEGSSVEDRRETIIARIRGQGKLNTATINNIVSAFTGGTAISWIDGSTLYVEITPPSSNKSYKFENVEQELKNKVPAHLDIVVMRNYYTWSEVKKNYPTWNDVKTLGTWESVLLNSTAPLTMRNMR